MSAVSSQAGEARLSRLRRFLLSEHGSRATLVVVLALEILVFSNIARNFLSTTNFLNSGRTMSVFLVVGVGATFGLISGALDISMGAVIALAGTVGTNVVVAGNPGWLAILAAVGSGVLAGLVNGIVVVKMRVNPIVATLGMLGIARGVAYVMDGGTGVIGNLTETGDVTFNVMQRSLWGISYSFIFAALFAAAGWVLLAKTRFGRYAYAVGGNPEAGRSVALPVDRLRILYLTLSGTCAGVAGFMLASQLGGTSANIAFGWELTIITAVILGGVSLAGGTGSMFGTILGVIILGLLENGATLAAWHTNYKLMVQGILLLFAVGMDAARTGGYR